MEMNIKKINLSGEPNELALSLASRYNQIKEDRMNLVMTWQSASAEMYDPRPFAMLANPTQGEWLANTGKQAPFVFGLDQAGDIVMSRIYEGDLCIAERFYFNLVDRLVHVAFRSRGGSMVLTSVWVANLANDLVVKYRGHTIDTRSRTATDILETYTYDEQTRRLTESAGSRTLARSQQEWHNIYEYDEEGDLLRIRWTRPDGDSGIKYQRPSYPMPDKNMILAMAERHLFDASIRTIRRFQEEHSNETWYAFAFMSSLEGRWVECAFATEQSLGRHVDRYIEEGYKVSFGNISELLAQKLRWEGPPHGWYVYPLIDGEEFTSLLTEVYANQLFKDCDGNTKAMSIRTLAKLDSAGTFGIGTAREALVLGFTYLVDPQDYIQSAYELNLAVAISRLQFEVNLGDQARSLIITPHHSRDA